MNCRSQKPVVRSQNRAAHWFVLLALLSSGWAAFADDFASFRADRAAIERIYYNHRLGEKPPFEQALPQATLENLVQQELRKEAALKKAYGVEVTPAMLDAEVQRINSTTRAPEMLAEIKTALGNDPARFARAMAKPILVERLLREKFDNDDALHAPQRRAVEMLRGQLLIARGSRGAPTNGMVEMLVTIMKASHSKAVTETIWQLGAHPSATNSPDSDEIEIKKRFGPNAQILASPSRASDERKVYFENLPLELQKVLRVQLRQAGDVSAVIETPGGFLLYVAKEKTDAVLSVVGLSLPKRSYEEWLAERSENQP
jgi:hypothetical protein